MNKGKKLETKKAAICKEYIRKYAVLHPAWMSYCSLHQIGRYGNRFCWYSAIPDSFLIKYLGISRNTYFKYKREVQCEPDIIEVATRRFSNYVCHKLKSRDANGNVISEDDWGIECANDEVTEEWSNGAEEIARALMAGETLC